MSLPDFIYRRPKTLAEALAILADDADARALAGGQTLLPALKQRLARPSQLVDLQDIPDLRGVTVGADAVTIGAMTPHHVTATDPAVGRAIPALAHLAGGIAHPQVRHRGTMGGSIANNDPAADYPAALVGLGATVQTTRRRIAADDFFTGLFLTALEPGELVLSIRFPRPRRAGYHKFPSLASGYVTTGAFVSEGPAGIRVAVNGAGPCVFRQADAEARLTRDFTPAALTGFAQPTEGLNSDLHAHARYRAQLVAVAIARALDMALAQPVPEPETLP
ncbi:FAD binding domain-containing protein [Ruixingdingia sedimenti]|uniref:FAD binding domain-containing protein n=1 Tax=Ruixingdingia sedimenti TaxID=3073604 RepID=A0ABU1F6D4_9RHOB|nr:FAD binding domain-containing protein [Xinfangfangia sp. LG-4]MDR5652436.1 FAD binding domain-containing protein [Xinfangfangia sp. LG-4]